MQGELWLNTDYGLYEKTVPVESKLTGILPAKVILGRLETSNATGLIGCIKVYNKHETARRRRREWKENCTISGCENRPATRCLAQIARRGSSQRRMRLVGFLRRQKRRLPTAWRLHRHLEFAHLHMRTR